jgi:hypothetical protein
MFMIARVATIDSVTARLSAVTSCSVAASGTHTVGIGAVLPVSKSLSLIAEYHPGRSQQNVGLVVSYIFPR